MIRDFQLADFLTLGNGLCGVAAIFQAMHFVATKDSFAIYIAAALIPIALVFDVLDGRVARSRGLASPLGRELDSLADVISFGVAPATIAYAAGLTTALDQIVLGFFVLCGLSRLARYNVSAAASTEPQGKVRYFEGTPIPTSVVALAILIAAFHFQYLTVSRIDRIEFHWPIFLFFVSGSLMISKTIRIPKP